MFPGHYSSDSRLEVTGDGHLKINAVQMGDEGHFVCSALNAAGSNSAKAALKVTGGSMSELGILFVKFRRALFQRCSSTPHRSF